MQAETINPSASARLRQGLGASSACGAQSFRPDLTSSRGPRRSADPIGKDADRVLCAGSRLGSPPGWDLWLGWGAAGDLHQRDQHVVEMLKQSLLHRRAGTAPLAIGTTRSGQRVILSMFQ